MKSMSLNTMRAQSLCYSNNTGWRLEMRNAIRSHGQDDFPESSFLSKVGKTGAPRENYPQT